MKQAAVGFRVHSGWSAAVVVCLEKGAPAVLRRQRRRWERTYNGVRPHQSLAYLNPLEFMTRWMDTQRKAKCH